MKVRNTVTGLLIKADGLEEILAIVARAVDGSFAYHSKGWLPAGQAKCEISHFKDGSP
jgi:hypothetical protein